jgi:hypothetical protein
MLELRPNCENCNKALPPESQEARICSFECTFCASCVRDVLANVCPNCGGGFCQRPVRPVRAWNGKAHLGEHPASTAVKHRPVNQKAHTAFAASVSKYPPQDR